VEAEEALRRAGIPSGARAEELGLADFLRLTEAHAA
jgi:16S rRNA A1518/A1519 N6-dimethyltransferase RsmA/KsgA/DIM1 with predicted DNA glycosylase/AP lyase activity